MIYVQPVVLVIYFFPFQSLLVIHHQSLLSGKDDPPYGTKEMCVCI